MPGSSVIIPAFNLAALTERCLQAVLAAGAREVLVVDDASTDETASMLARYADRVRIVTHRANEGFARSCNDGAAEATGEFVVFLNNDTIPQAGWLAALEAYAAAHPPAAVVGSKLIYPDRTIQHAGVVIAQDRYPRHLYAGFPADHPAVCRSRRFQMVTAACMLVRRAVFEQAGGFDPAFRNGFEDVDFCLRLGARGHEIHYCAESVVMHFESVSPGRFKNRRQNVDQYRERWMPGVRPDDVDYYLADGLMRFHYEGRYPVGLEVSPLLATLEEATRHGDVERLLRVRSREVADLQRETTRLRIALGAAAPDSPELLYQQARDRIRRAVEAKVPPGATILVVSNGDGSLLEYPGRHGWHFPQTERGAYAGHHPADSAEALAQLQALQAKGAGYFLIPPPSFWWLDHYAGLGRYLETHGSRLDAPEDGCALYALGGGR